MKNVSFSAGKILFISAFISVASLSANTALAKVTGVCGNCHIMHNSQDGSAVVHSDAAWNADGTLSGASPSDSPVSMGRLLKADCVGCHSSSTGETIINTGGSKVPIVLNTGGYPAKPLAGGNFYFMTQGTDYHTYGHNVYGIADPDVNISEAPGNRSGCWTGSCHYSLANPPSNTAGPGGNFGRGGCQGCHYNVFHHEDNGNYRFLNSHYYEVGGYVEGKEDPNWEHDPSMAASNKYLGFVTTDGEELADTHSISSYCGGCHKDFHAKDDGGTGTVSPWLRHPTDIVLPEDPDKEYKNYDPTSTYSNLAPVAWLDPENPARSGAIVMCLSCHRPHASDQPDLLRWDYEACQAGTEDADCGCFVCHNTKD